MRSRGSRWGVGVWAALALALAEAAAGQSYDEMLDQMGRPFDPVRIAGDLYYVGTRDVTAFLWTGPEGHILLDGGFPENAPMIRANIEALGFRLDDVRVLLNSHAHFDHAGGLAQLKAWSGARMVASEGDRARLEAGGRGDPIIGDDGLFPAVAVDEVIADRGEVRLGDRVMTAHVTAGHTPGCTTWHARVPDGDRVLDVVFVCSLTVLPGVRLTGPEATWPGIDRDFERSFERLDSLPVDVFLASHGSFFGLEAKAELVWGGATPDNPFIDPDRYRRYLERARARFDERLTAERGPGERGPGER